MNKKKEQFNAIYYYFLNVVYAYYLIKGKVGSEIFKYSFEELKRKSKELSLSAVLERDGEDIILIVEKPEEYTVVSTKLDIYTYEDEEMEAQ
jgi:hypothetical protein